MSTTPQPNEPLVRHGFIYNDLSLATNETRGFYARPEDEITRPAALVRLDDIPALVEAAARVLNERHCGPEFSETFMEHDREDVRAMFRAIGLLLAKEDNT